MFNNPWGTVRFTDKVALITGGASGIGRATANRLAAEGAHVIIADNNVSLANQAVSQIKADGGKASHIEVDLADDEAVAACGRAVAERFPALHMLVNNAAILRHGRIEDGSWQGNWDAETAIGLRGWVLMTQVYCRCSRRRAAPSSISRRKPVFSAGPACGSTTPLKPVWYPSRRPWHRSSSATGFASTPLRPAGLSRRCTLGLRPTPPHERRSWRRRQTKAAS